MDSTPDIRISLVLGSGGARGLAHIGVIRWLEENGLRIQSISGCSIGALIGGIYAAGQLYKFEQWVVAISKLEMISLLDIAWGNTGLVRGDRIIDALVDLVGDRQIEDLAIPFTAVAADIEGEKEVWINSGNLFDAIRASISLPLFFTPFNHNGIQLIDGGVLNPVPIAPTFGDDTDMTIAVNLGGAMETTEQPAIEASAAEPSSPSIKAKISQFIERFSQSSDNPDSSDWDAYDVANQAFDAMQSTIARLKLAAYPPDETIEIPRNACGTLEFDRATEMIELGYRKASEQLAAFKR